ncbi:MAG: type II secretion system GspH family protein [Vampirovibrionales bacterium]|nr:type II secretion system GspH family protein [Vampirovibrionales bacterium]
MPHIFFKQRQNALTLIEILVSLSIIAFLSLLMGVIIRAMDDMRASAANKVVQAIMYDIQKANTRFVSSGGWITTDTHITQIMNNLDVTDVIDVASIPPVTINGFEPNTPLTCGGTFTCYVLNSGGTLAVQSFSSGDRVGTNGFFAPSAGNATEVNGHTTLPVLIDPDGIFKANDPSSASSQFTLDELARLTPRANGQSTIAGVTATQAAYFNTNS